MFDVVLLLKAQRDLDKISGYLKQHSVAGALSWLTALEDAIAKLAANPSRFALAREANEVTFVLRSITFKTRRGRGYRLLYTIVGSQVRVLRIVGPNHNLLKADDL